MALDDYDSLRDELSSWTARNDTTFRNRFDTFLTLVEDRLYHGAGMDGDPLQSDPLRASAMSTSGTMAFAAGVSTLPTDLLEVRALHPAGQESGIEYLPPERFHVASATNMGSLPLYYTVEHRTVTLHPALTGNATVVYFKEFDRITSNNKTGTLLSAHPAIYLSGLLFEAYSWMEEPETAVAHLARMRSQIAGANKNARGVRFGAQARRIRPRQPIS